MKSLQLPTAAAAMMLARLEQAVAILDSDYAKHGAEAARSATAVVAAMGPCGRASAQQGWRQTWVDAVVALLARLQQAEEHLRAACLGSVRRRLGLVVKSVENMAVAAARSALHYGYERRMRVVLEAALLAQHRVLAKISSLTKADVESRARNVAYVRQTVAAGTCVMATSCDDVPLAVGMRVRLPPDKEDDTVRDKGPVGVLEKPVYSGGGLTAMLTGWVVRMEKKNASAGAGKERDDGAVRRVLGLDEFPSQHGIAIWAHLPLQVRMIGCSGAQVPMCSIISSP